MLSESGLINGLIEIGPVAEGPLLTNVTLIFVGFYLLVLFIDQNRESREWLPCSLFCDILE